MRRRSPLRSSWYRRTVTKYVVWQVYAGKRLILSSESEEGQRLSASIVKRLASTDRIRARELYKEEFDFEPTHTLVMFTNHLPKISGIDHGIWRRIHAIPFDARFDGEGHETEPELRGSASTGRRERNPSLADRRRTNVPREWKPLA